MHVTTRFSRLSGALGLALVLLTSVANAQSPDPAAWPTDDAMLDTQAVAVGFRYTDSDWPISRAHTNNLVAWALRFKSMGVPPENVLLISDVPADELELWLRGWHAWHPDLRIAYARGPAGLSAALGDPPTGRGATPTTPPTRAPSWRGVGTVCSATAGSPRGSPPPAAWARCPC